MQKINQFNKLSNLAKLCNKCKLIHLTIPVSLIIRFIEIMNFSAATAGKKDDPLDPSNYGPRIDEFKEPRFLE